MEQLFIKIKKNKSIAPKIVLYVVMIIIAVIMIFPFYWQIIISFRQRDAITSGNLSLFPSALTLQNYITVFKGTFLVKAFFNTMFITLINITTNLVLGALAAYGFAKINFKGNKLIFKIMLMSMMLPGVVTLVPSYQIIVAMGLINSYLGILLPGTVGVFGIFFLRSFFLTLPDEIAEAGRIDGAGELKIFSMLYIPLMVPALLTLSIFCFQGSWNSFVWPNLILVTEKENLGVLTMVIRQYTINNNASYGETMALAFLTSLPVLIFFCFAQKYFISGVAVGAVKG